MSEQDTWTSEEEDVKDRGMIYNHPKPLAGGHMLKTTIHWGAVLAALAAGIEAVSGIIPGDTVTTGTLLLAVSAGVTAAIHAYESRQDAGQ